MDSPSSMLLTSFMLNYNMKVVKEYSLVLESSSGKERHYYVIHADGSHHFLFAEKIESKQEENGQ